MFGLGRYCREAEKALNSIRRALDLLTQAADGGDLEARRRLSDLLAMSDPLH